MYQQYNSGFYADPHLKFYFDDLKKQKAIGVADYQEFERRAEEHIEADLTDHPLESDLKLSLNPLKNTVTKIFSSLIREAAQEKVEIISAECIYKLIYDQLKTELNLTTEDLLFKKLFVARFENFLNITSTDKISRKISAGTKGYKLFRSVKANFNCHEYLIRNYNDKARSKRQTDYYTAEIERGQRDPANKWLYNPSVESSLDTVINLAHSYLVNNDVEALAVDSCLYAAGVTKKAFKNYRIENSKREYKHQLESKLMDKGLVITSSWEWNTSSINEEKSLGMKQCFKLAEKSEIVEHFARKFRVEDQARSEDNSKDSSEDSSEST